MGVCRRFPSLCDLRMLPRSYLGALIVFTLLVVTSGFLPNTHTARDVSADGQYSGDTGLTSAGDAGLRAVVKRNADAAKEGAPKRKRKNKEGKNKEKKVKTNSRKNNKGKNKSRKKNQRKKKKGKKKTGKKKKKKKKKK